MNLPALRCVALLSALLQWTCCRGTRLETLCRHECHLLRRRLEPHEHCKRAVVASTPHTVASGACLTGFVAGFRDECETACALEFKEVERPSTGSAPCDDAACRVGYEAGVAQTRRHFRLPEHGPKTTSAAKPPPSWHAVEVEYKGGTVVLSVPEQGAHRHHAAANAWCREHEPHNHGCPRVLLLLLERGAAP